MSKLKLFDEIQLTEERRKIFKHFIKKKKKAIINIIEDLSLSATKLEDQAFDYIYEWHPELDGLGIKISGKTGKIVIIGMAKEE